MSTTNPLKPEKIFDWRSFDWQKAITDAEQLMSETQDKDEKDNLKVVIGWFRYRLRMVERNKVD